MSQHIPRYSATTLNYAGIRVGTAEHAGIFVSGSIVWATGKNQIVSCDACGSSGQSGATDLTVVEGYDISQIRLSFRSVSRLQARIFWASIVDVTCIGTCCVMVFVVWSMCSS